MVCTTADVTIAFPALCSSVSSTRAVLSSKGVAADVVSADPLRTRVVLGNSTGAEKCLTNITTLII